MKTRTSLFLFLFILTVLSLSIADIFSPTGFAQKRVLATISNASLDERIQRVENGLLPPVIIKAEPDSAMNLARRMQFYKTPGVSVAVINNGKIEWARGYGVLEVGGEKTVTTETLFQSVSISKPVAAFAALRLVQENKLHLAEGKDAIVELLAINGIKERFQANSDVVLRS